MKKDLNPVFDVLVSRYVTTIERSFLSRYKRAKDKEFIADEIKQETDFILDWAFADSGIKELVITFSKRYKRGENIDEILSDLKRIYGDIEDIKTL